jgi:Zn-dependent protease
VNGPRIGRYRGIPVRAHPSVLVVVALVAVLLAQNVLPAAAHGAATPAYWAVAVATACLLMASLLAHELAHALLARRYAVRVKDITLWALGGVTTFEDEPPTPRADALIAIAGPVTSLVLGGVFVVGTLSCDPGWLHGLPAVALDWLAVTNVLLGLFNLVPAPPLDGGRALRAWQWARSGDRDDATEKTAAVGQAFGFGLVALGVVITMSGYLTGLWLVLVGWFITSSATIERRQSRTFHKLRDVRVRDVMTARPVIAPGWWTVDAFVAHLAADDVHHRVFPVVDFEGRPVGVVSLARLAAAQQAARQAARLEDAAVPIASCARARSDEPLTEVLRRNGVRPDELLLVVDDEVLAGILTNADVARAVELSRLDVTPAAGADRPPA